MFEIQLDTSCTEPYVQHEEGGFVRLILSPTNSLDMALIECHQRLVDALHKEFQSIFSDRSVARTFEIKNGTVVIRRA